MILRHTSRLVALVLSLSAYACTGPSARPAMSSTETSGAIVPNAGQRPDERAAADRLLADSLYALVGATGGSASPGQGFLVLHLPNEKLFETGRVEVSAAGQELLESLVPLLQAVQAADVERPTTYTSGPVLITAYPSDWPLSAARASTLAQLLHTLEADAQATPTARGNEAASSLPSRRIDLRLPASAQFQRVYFDRKRGG